MPNPKPTLILGGGPTALAAAVRLARAGHPVKVIEKLPWTGGLCKTFTHGPYHLDLGPHRFTPHVKEVLDFVSDLCPGELRITRYRAEILVGEKFVRYPFRLPELLTRIPPTLSLRLLGNYLAAALQRNKTQPEITYEEWVEHRFGNGITEIIFRPLIEKVWGTPLSRLAARFASQRIAVTSLWEIAWEILSGHRDPKFRSLFYPDNCFLYPEMGFGRITDRMAEEVVKCGGVVQTNATVKQITKKGNRIESVGYEKEGKLILEEPQAVISTLPIQYFFRVLKPATNPELLQTAEKLKTRRLILLYLVLKKERFSENTSLYFPSRDFPYGRIWEQKNHSPKMIPVPDRTVLGLEIPCWRDDDIWTSDDKTLFERAVAPLEKREILNRQNVEEFFSVRLGWVYPVWDVDFERNINTLLDYERHIENLIFNGRPGLFFYNNIHHSIEMGLLSANHVLSGLPKSQKWDIDSKKFEKYHLVE